MRLTSIMNKHITSIAICLLLFSTNSQASNESKVEHTLNNGLTLIVMGSDLSIKDKKGVIKEFKSIIPSTLSKYGIHNQLFDVIIPESKAITSKKIAVYIDEEPVFLSQDGVQHSFIFKSIKEDYLTKQFHIYINLNIRKEILEIAKIIEITRAPECENNYISARDIKTANFSEINSKNSKNLYSHLYNMNDNEYGNVKVPFIDDLDIYNIALENYRTKKSLTDASLFIMENRSYDKCTPESYVAERWFWSGYIEASNNIAFLLSEAGYHLEAITLLEKIITTSPQRTPAYLNMADSLWALHQYDRAHRFYERYISQMKTKKLDSKIPSRVKERIKIIDTTKIKLTVHCRLAPKKLHYPQQQYSRQLDNI